MFQRCQMYLICMFLASFDYKNLKSKYFLDTRYLNKHKIILINNLVLDNDIKH